MSIEKTSNDESTSLTLLARVRLDDPFAWSRLTKLYGPLVYGWCIQMGLAPSDAADVGQEVFLRVWRGIGVFRRDRQGDSFRAWLRIITKRQALDHWRKRKREPAPISLQLDVEEALPNEVDLLGATQERLLLYRRAIDLLQEEFSPNTIAAFWKSVVEERCAQEIASQLSMSVNSVYIAKSRVLSRLRQELATE